MILPLRRAFDVRRHFHELWAPPTRPYPAVDGLRAVAILWMVAFHAVWLLGLLPSAEVFRSVSAWPAVRILLHEGPRTNLFFVISGFLITDLLIRELQSTKNLQVGRFYLRRLLRLFPGYLCALGLSHVFLTPYLPFSIPHLFFIQNFFPAWDQIMPWAWSLAVEVQFYLVVPFLVFVVWRHPNVGKKLSLLLLLGSGLGLGWLHDWYNIPWPIPSHPSLAPSSFSLYFNAVHIKPYTYIGSLVCGMSVAFLLATSSWRPNARQGWMGGAIGAAAIGFGAGWFGVPSLESPRMLTLAYVGFSTTAFSLGIACWLTLSLTSTPAGVWFRSWLGWKGWHPVARLAYSTFLLHPIVIWMWYQTYPPAFSTITGLISHLVIGILMSLTAALPLYVLVERPFMILRPRSVGQFVR